MRVFLFSGHVVDAPGRSPPRFPLARVPAAVAAIEALLDELHAGPGDLALTQGAAGGDLLFAEACQRRGVPLQLLLPQKEDAFLRDSVLPSDGGNTWRQRWHTVREGLAQAPQVLPPGTDDIYERCNRWLLDTALARGTERLHFICLWDGMPGGTGGTGHMVREVQAQGGHVLRIDPHQLAP